MSIHILVPQERLAELLKKEVFADFASGKNLGAAHNFEGIEAATGTLRSFFTRMGCDDKIEEIEEALQAGDIADYANLYECTVDEEDPYLQNLEDTLGDEE